MAEPSDVLISAAPVAEAGTPSPLSDSGGQGSVSTQTGAFQYAYPISIPPGRAGNAPSLALTYSSDGPVAGGIASGWSLGIPVIARDWSLGEFAPVRWLGLSGRELIETVEPAPAGQVTTFREQSDSSFARYQYFESNDTWRVLTTDGTKLYFGEPDYMNQATYSDWVPLTRSVDAFGNEVHYHWFPNAPLLGDYAGSRIDRIEYTLNSAAGIPAHARVLFTYDTAERPCIDGAPPIGVSQSYRGARRRMPGYYKLERIATEVQSSAGWRPVKRYELNYGHPADTRWDCNGDHEPMRVLTNISLFATGRTGNVIGAPTMSFDYAFAATPGSVLGDGKTVQGLASIMPKGTRHPFPRSGDSTDSMLLDINGDGLLDYVEADQVVVPLFGTQCAISWHPNQGLNAQGQPSFGAKRTTPLETIDWANGDPFGHNDGSPQGVEYCSLSGQFSMAIVVPPNNFYKDYQQAISDADLGTLLMYQFRDMNRDGLIDVSTGLSGIASYLPVQRHGYRDPGNCPPPIAGVAPFAPDPEEPPPNPLVRGPIAEGSYCYHWKVWANVDQGSDLHNFDLLTAFNAPAPVYAESRDPVTLANRSMQSARSWISDMDGDGFIDFGRVDYTPFEVPGEYWYVYRFNGTGIEAPLAWPFAGSVVFPKPFPSQTYDQETNPEQPLDTRRIEHSALLDVNGDGLPDLYRMSSSFDALEVFYNNGSGFEHKKNVPVLGGAPPTFLSEANIDSFGNGSANRYQLHRILGIERHSLPTIFSHLDFAGDPDAVFYNLGDGSLTRKPTYDMSPKQVVSIGRSSWTTTGDAIDLDGDGIRDAVGDFSGGTVFVPTVPDAAPRGFLTAVHNGRGLSTLVDYAPLTNTSVVTIGDGQHPSSRWVVEKLTTIQTVGGTPSSVTNWRYSTPTRNDDDRGLIGFRGFKEVTMTGPSGASTRTEFDYNTDYAGRVSSAMVFQAGSANPTSIDDFAHSVETLFVGNSTPLNFFTSDKRSYTCEYLLSGAQATHSEAGCRSQVRPRREFSIWESLAAPAGIFARHSSSTFDGESITEGLLEGFFGHSSVNWLYTADDYRIVTTRTEKITGTAIKNDGDWTVSGDRAGLVEHQLDSSLRTIRRTCVALSEDEVLAGGTVDTTKASCTAFEYDMSVGLLTKTQKPNQYYEEVVIGGAEPLAARFGEVVYFDPADPDSQFQVYPVKVTGELGHTVTMTADLATGASLSTQGPNPGTGSYVEIDAFGRVTEKWETTSANTYRRTHLISYNDGSFPQSSVVRTATQPRTAAQWDSEYTSLFFQEVRANYDGLGRPFEITEWDVDNNVAKASTSFTYDAAGNLVKTTAPDPAQDDNSATVDYLTTFDSLGRTTCTTGPNGVGVSTVLAGRTSRGSEFVPDGGGAGTCANPTSSPLEPTASKTLVSDIFDRVIREEEVLDTTSPTDVSVTTYAYDANSNVVEVVRESGSDQDVVTTMSHDWAGNRLEVLRHGRRWSYAYDRNGNIVSQLAPHNGQAAPYTSSHVYDDLDRKTSRIMAVADLSPSEITEFDVGTWLYEYDQGSYGKGKLTRARSPSDARIVDYTYNARGLPYQATSSVDLNASLGVPLAASFTKTLIGHTTAGGAASVIHESGVRTATQYKRAGYRPYYTAVLQPGSTSLIDDQFYFDRNVAGLPTKLRHVSRHPVTAAGRIVDFTYDNVGRAAVVESNDPAAEKIRQSYTFSGTNEVIAMSSSVGNLVTPRSYVFDYDDRHQLTAASDDQGYSAAFTYGRTGTLQSSFVAAASAPGSHVTPRDVDYDYANATAASGHRDPELALSLLDASTGEPTVSYSYDDAGSMTSRVTDSEVVTMRYDGDQRLRKRTIASEGSHRTYFYMDGARWLEAENVEGQYGKIRLWFGDVEVIYSCSQSPCFETETRTTIRLGGRAVARIDQDPFGNRETELLHTNGLGHLLGVYSMVKPSSGSIDYTLEAAFQYGPFGEILESATPSGSPGELDAHLQRFNGKEFDTETGLSYYGYRYYEPIGQIWNRADPMYRFVPDAAGGDARRGNLYTFSGNNPMRYVDPDGLDIRADVDRAYRRAVGNASRYCGSDARCYSKTIAALNRIYLAVLGAIHAANDEIARKSQTTRVGPETVSLVSYQTVIAGGCREAADLACDIVGAVNDKLESLENALAGGTTNILEGVNDALNPVKQGERIGDAFGEAKVQHDLGDDSGAARSILRGVVEIALSVPGAATGLRSVARLFRVKTTGWVASVGAGRWVPRVLQGGTRTIRKSTARALNAFFDLNLHSRDWGRAVELLKKTNGYPNNFHGKILENGDYLDKAGQVIDNIADYLP